MTPKEKAIYLIEKYIPHAYNGTWEEDDPSIELHHAKQCAMIAVDELIKTIDNLYTGEKYVILIDLKEIKQEIENYSFL